MTDEMTTDPADRFVPDQITQAPIIEVLSVPQDACFEPVTITQRRADEEVLELWALYKRGGRAP